jgi:chitinase
MRNFAIQVKWAVCCLFFLCLGCQAQPRIVGYFTDETNLQNLNPQYLTHIIYAFAKISPDGQVVLGSPDSAKYISQLVALKQQNRNLKVMISVGGWGAGGFSDAALSDASREKFAVSAADLIRQNALDGLDVDWEYPGQAGAGNTFRAQDKENFTLLLKTLREKFDAMSQQANRAAGDRYLLTIADGAGEYFQHVQMSSVQQQLDWINVMTYDMYGGWADHTGHHSGLYPSALNYQPQLTAQSYVQQHLDAGVPPGKIVIGAAFYGHIWTNVNPDHNGLNQTHQGKSAVDTLTYKQLAADYINKNGFVRYWDDSAKAPYLWNASSKTFISYEDPESIKAKADFVKSKKLGGIMYWQQAHDLDQQLLRAIHDSLR